jgi:hypothetical protein
MSLIKMRRRMNLTCMNLLMDSFHTKCGKRVITFRELERVRPDTEQFRQWNYEFSQRGEE